MPAFSIPLKTSASSSSVSYDTAIDASYGVYNATLKDYPVGNAFVDGANTSQVKWGLQISARATQNTTWKAQISYGVASGTGAFSLNSITYPFTRTIAKIESGNIQTMMYQNGLSAITFDDVTTNKINNVRIVPSTSIITATMNQKGYIATNTNKFVAICDGANVQTFPCDANGTITSSTAASSVTMATVQRAYVVAAKGAYVWIVGILQNRENPGLYNKWYGQLYTITTAGVLSTVGAVVTIYNSGAANGTTGGVQTNGEALGSYVVNNVAHVIGAGQVTNDLIGGYSSSFYDTVDLSTITIFTTTLVKQDATTSLGIASGTGKVFNVGYNGTHGLVVTNLGTAGTPDVYQVNTAAGFVDSTVNYFETYVRQCRYKNTTTKLSTTTANTFMSGSNSIKIDNNAVSGTFTNLDINNLWFYEMTGTNQEDDTNAFKCVYIPCSAIGIGGGNITLKVNGTLALTKTMNHINYVAADLNFTFSTVVTVSDSKINFLLEYPNTLAQDYKLGFGLNGGTYASPTGTFELSSITLALS